MCMGMNTITFTILSSIFVGFFLRKAGVMQCLELSYWVTRSWVQSIYLFSRPHSCGNLLTLGLLFFICWIFFLWSCCENFQDPRCAEGYRHHEYPWPSVNVSVRLKYWNDVFNDWFLWESCCGPLPAEIVTWAQGSKLLHSYGLTIMFVCFQ